MEWHVNDFIWLRSHYPVYGYTKMLGEAMIVLQVERTYLTIQRGSTRTERIKRADIEKWWREGLVYVDIEGEGCYV